MGWGDNSSDCPIIQINRCGRGDSPEAEKRIVGIRKGEKLYEVMVTQEESFNTVKRDNTT